MGKLRKTIVPTVDIANVSFIVTTKKCGEGGQLKCQAVHTDGKEAKVKYEKLEDGFYRVRIFPLRTGPLHLHIDYLDPE